MFSDGGSALGHDKKYP